MARTMPSYDDSAPSVKLQLNEVYKALPRGNAVKVSGVDLSWYIEPSRSEMPIVKLLREESNLQRMGSEEMKSKLQQARKS